MSNTQGIILHRQRLLHPNFGDVPVAPEAHVGVSVSRDLKLFGREIIFESIPTHVITVPKRYGRTDRQTDDVQYRNRALRSIAR